MSDLVFRRNLLALSPRSPDLAALLDETEPDPRLSFRAARSGALVPVYAKDGREAAFHSLMDPRRDAERLAAAQPPGGFIAALGLGAGYGLAPYLASSATTGILVVEYSAPLLRAVLEEFDLSELFLDPRFSLLLDPEPREIEAALLASYIPPLAGDLRSVPLRGRVDQDPGLFAGAAAAIRKVLDRISDDYSVQAFFGKLWFRNAVRNLFAAERPASPLPPIRRAVVTAAGPSLEAALPAVAKARGEGAFLIATDTSLPALLGSGMRPDAVVSIDCQAISYYHFLKGLPAGVPLVLDLASPNRLARLGGELRFFSSGHPFCAYLSSRFRPFPALDTSGGNVTHAALSLAEALGAESALLAGADFSYPEGKSYARGTYIYDYFDALSGRLSPSESLFSGFIFRNASVFRETDRTPEGKEYSRFVTKPLVAYREHLERFAAASSLAVRPLRGLGVEIRIPEGQARKRRERAVFAAGHASMSAADFLRRYAADLAALPAPAEPAAAYLGALAPAERDLWTTLLPSASALQRALGLAKAAAGAEAGGSGPAVQDAAERAAALAAAGPAALLESVRSWALDEIAEALEAAGR